ncbi:hypothetical protein [Embleya scabrispora]|uniref:hypothetical protein n=1 Tax=Embleya scabrispora TaxID=159449 RepID=UPI00131A428B|nr:hypothetical protein [Embleya scabrispora]MYS81098.1 hypothetical protein [Streptomyces sp. SID5474]
MDDPWRVREEDRLATTADPLRSWGRERRAGGSGTLWRSTVPAEERMLITALMGDAEEQLVGLRGAQTDSTADAARPYARGNPGGAGIPMARRTRR